MKAVWKDIHGYTSLFIDLSLEEREVLVETEVFVTTQGVQFGIGSETVVFKNFARRALATGIQYEIEIGQETPHELDNPSPQLAWAGYYHIEDRKRLEAAVSELDRFLIDALDPVNSSKLYGFWA